MRSTVEATSERLPESLLSSAEYDALTRSDLVAAATQCRPQVQKGPSGAATGPMWVAGRPPPFVGQGAKPEK